MWLELRPDLGLKARSAVSELCGHGQGNQPL